MKKNYDDLQGIIIITMMPFLFTFFLLPKFIIYIFYNCIMGFALGGVISCRINKDVCGKNQIISVIIALCVVFFAFINSHFDIMTMCCYDSHAMNWFIPSGIIYIIYITLLVICLTLIAFYGIRQNTFINKQYILTVLILASFFVYLFFAFDLYVLSFYGNEREIQCKYEIGLSKFLVFDFLSFLFHSCKHIPLTGHESKIYDNEILVIINFLSCIIGFLITIFSGWFIIRYICFSEKAVSLQIYSKSEIQIRRNIISFLLIIIIFSGIILFGIWQYIRKPDIDKLNYACKEANIQLVKEILMKKPELVNDRDYYFRKTPLHYAVEKDSMELIEFLIYKGADVNTQSYNRMTPLHYAIENHSKAAAEFLISKGADININPYNTSTPLHWAVSMAGKPSEELAEFLVSKGADVNAEEKPFKNTPLHYAVLNTSINTVKLLVFKGANINAKNCHSMTPLFDAVKSDKKEIIKFLINKGGEVNLKDDFDITLLHYAAEKGNKEIVELLIKKGADVNAKDKNGKTPLDYALESDKKEIIDFLEKHGAK